MKIAELVKENAALLELMRVNDVAPNDIIYLPIIEAYSEMRARGFKTTFIVAYLTKKHNVSESNFYRALKKFKLDVKIENTVKF